MFHSIATIENINDKKEVLATLSIFDDEDFNGNNGDEYLWEVAKGFESNQDYVLDTLDKSDLTGEQLVYMYFDMWLGNDGYYGDYDVIVDSFSDNKAVVSVAYETNT